MTSPEHAKDDNDTRDDRRQPHVHFALSDPRVTECHGDMNEEETRATWFSPEELDVMQANDEFALMKLAYSRWARCSCCKGYALCRGLEYRCSTRLNARNTSVAECRNLVLQAQKDQNTPHQLALKYRELCQKDAEAAVEMGRLDALAAQGLLGESWKIRTPEDEEAYVELSQSGGEEDDLISEISFEGHPTPLCETLFEKSDRRKLGILKRTGRFLREALKPIRIR